MAMACRPWGCAVGIHGAVDPLPFTLGHPPNEHSPQKDSNRAQDCRHGFYLFCVLQPPEATGLKTEAAPMATLLDTREQAIDQPIGKIAGRGVQCGHRGL